jgi:hypothetical protein
MYDYFISRPMTFISDFNKTSVIINLPYFELQALLVSCWLNPTACTSIITETLEEKLLLININRQCPVSGKSKAQVGPYRLVCSRTYVQLSACMYVYVTFSDAQFSSVAILPACFVSLLYFTIEMQWRLFWLLLFPFRAVQFLQLVNLRVSRDTMKIELDSYHLCKCTFQSAETDCKART